MTIFTEAGWQEREGIFIMKPLFESFDQVHSGLVLLTIDTRWAVFDHKDVNISLRKNMQVDFYHSADSWDVFTRLEKRSVFESFNCKCLFHSQYKYQTSIWDYVNWWNSIQTIKWNVILPLSMAIKSYSNKLSATVQFSLPLKLCNSWCLPLIVQIIYFNFLSFLI